MNISSDRLQIQITATIDVDTGISYQGQRDCLRHMGYTFNFLEDFGAMVMDHFDVGREWFSWDTPNGLPLMYWARKGSTPPTADFPPLSAESFRRAHLELSIRKECLYDLPDQLYRMLADPDHARFKELSVLGFPVTISAMTLVPEAQIPDGRLGQKIIDGDLPYLRHLLLRRGHRFLAPSKTPAP